MPRTKLTRPNSSRFILHTCFNPIRTKKRVLVDPNKLRYPSDLPMVHHSPSNPIRYIINSMCLTIHLRFITATMATQQNLQVADPNISLINSLSKHFESIPSILTTLTRFSLIKPTRPHFLNIVPISICKSPQVTYLCFKDL